MHRYSSYLIGIKFEEQLEAIPNDMNFPPGQVKTCHSWKSNVEEPESKPTQVQTNMCTEEASDQTHRPHFQALQT